MNSRSKVIGFMKILVAVGALAISGIIVYYVISGVITLVPKRETYDWTKMRFFEQLDTEISLGTLKDVKDDYTRKVLYSQFIDEYYQEAFAAILDEFQKGRIQRVKRTNSVKGETDDTK